MHHTLILVESFSKCAKIESFLGAGYKCLATNGHIRALTAVDVKNNFAPTFVQDAEKCKELRRAVQELNGGGQPSGKAVVLLATDDDREGEAIAWHLCVVLKLPVETTLRLVFHEVTQSALLSGLQNLRPVNMALVEAQLCRQTLDYLVGYKVSPVLKKAIEVKDEKVSLSAGRCQTPALRLVYDNQAKIDAQAEAVGAQAAAATGMTSSRYTVTAYCTSLNLPFTCTAAADDVAQRLTQLPLQLTYSRTSDQLSTLKPPLPFKTSTLLQAAHRELNLTASQTMAACQRLYEAGAITYLRTDSTRLSSDFVERDARPFIAKTYGPLYDKPLPQKPHEQALAHEAIRPTRLATTTTFCENSTEERVYNLIFYRTIESCMPAAQMTRFTAHLASFAYATQQVVFPGWQVVRGGAANEGAANDTNKAYAFLKALKVGSLIPWKKLTAQIDLTTLTPLPHYSEADLIQALEEHGLGRPSTFALLVAKLVDRGYVKQSGNIKGRAWQGPEYVIAQPGATLKINQVVDRLYGGEKNKLLITPLGQQVIEVLKEPFADLFAYDYTRKFEAALDDLQQQQDHQHHHYENYSVLCQSFYTDLLAMKATVSKGCLSKTPTSLVKRVLGDYAGYPITLFNKGKFGPYVEWQGLNRSVASLTKWPSERSLESLTLVDVVPLFLPTEKEPAAAQSQSPKHPLELRRINADAAIRSGPHGNYIFYRPEKLLKARPKFLKLPASLPTDYLTCDQALLQSWFTTHYDLHP